MGAGLVYQLSLGQQFGVLALFQVLAVLFGYWLLSGFVKRWVPQEWSAEKNIFAAANNAITDATGKFSYFSILVTASLVFFFVLIIGFETYVASSLLTPLVVPTAASNETAALWMSVVILTASLIYTLAGGLKAVLATDTLQLCGMVALIGTVLFLSVFHHQQKTTVPSPTVSDQAEEGTDNLAPIPGDSSDSVGTRYLTLFALIVFAVATQFYSPVNWGTVSHLDKASGVSILMQGGILGAALLGGITFCGVLLSGEGDAFTTIQDAIGALSGTNALLGYILRFVMVAGMSSMVFSTVDSIVIHLVQLVNDNILERDSKSTTDDSYQLWLIRVVSTLVFLFASVPLFFLHWKRPDIIYTLMGSIAGLNVLAPLCCLVPFLGSSEQSRLAILSNGTLGLFAVAIGVASLSGISLAIFDMNTAVTAVSFAALSVSVFMCLLLSMSGHTPLGSGERQTDQDSRPPEIHVANTGVYERFSRKEWLIISMGSLFVIGAWLTNLIFGFTWFDVTTRGPLGDTFGAVNALFSGLALLFIIWTLLLQNRDLRTQFSEIQDTRKAHQNQLELNSHMEIMRTTRELLTLAIQNPELAKSIKYPLDEWDAAKSYMQMWMNRFYTTWIYDTIRSDQRDQDNIDQQIREAELDDIRQFFTSNVAAVEHWHDVSNAYPKQFREFINGCIVSKPPEET